MEPGAHHAADRAGEVAERREAFSRGPVGIALGALILGADRLRTRARVAGCISLLRGVRELVREQGITSGRPLLRRARAHHDVLADREGNRVFVFCFLGRFGPPVDAGALRAERPGELVVDGFAGAKIRFERIE